MANEIAGLVRFAGVSVDNLVITPAQSMHAAVAGRVFGAVGPLGRPARSVHDGVTRTAYSLVRRTARATTGLISSAADALAGDDDRKRSGRARQTLG